MKNTICGKLRTSGKNRVSGKATRQNSAKTRIIMYIITYLPMKVNICGAEVGVKFSFSKKERLAFFAAIDYNKKENRLIIWAVTKMRGFRSRERGPAASGVSVHCYYTTHPAKNQVDYKHFYISYKENAFLLCKTLIFGKIIRKMPRPDVFRIESSFRAGM